MIRCLTAALLALFLVGCSVDDAVARSEAALTQARLIKADADTALIAAQDTAAGLRKLAESLHADKAAAVLAQADAMVAQAQAASKRIDTTLTVAESAVDAAKSAQAAGGSLWDVLIGAVGALVPGAGGALLLVRRLAQYRTAVTLTAAHADRMEEAETAADVDAAKLKAKREQDLHGVASLIEKARV